MPLTVEVIFLLDGFAASDGHDGTPPEWPPCPARLFSALVAGAEAEGDEAFRWLETQPLPIIHAGETALSDPQPQWLVTNRIQAGGGSANHPGRKNVERARYRCWLERPSVSYHWPQAQPDPETVRTLDEAARRVHYLGRPTSPVAIRVHADPPPPSDDATWRPGAEGLERVRLRVPYPGFFDQLRDAYEHGHRVDPPIYEHYEPPGAAPPALEEVEPAASPWAHFLVLPLTTRVWIPGERTLEVTGALRAVVLDLVGHSCPTISPLVSGHGAPPPHCAYLALPFTGHEHADGHLLAVAIAVPPDQHAMRQIRDALDPSGKGTYAIELRNVRGTRSLRFEHNPASLTRVPWGARAERWVKAATRWRTVLPAVLDRAPSRRLTEEEAVLETVRNAGLAQWLTAVEVQRAPFRQGDLALRPSHVRRNGTDRARPYRHLRLHFDRPVRGPVVLGALRHFGLGLCVPDEEEQRSG